MHVLSDYRREIPTHHKLTHVPTTTCKPAHSSPEAPPVSVVTDTVFEWLSVETPPRTPRTDAGVDKLVGEDHLH